VSYLFPIDAATNAEARSTGVFTDYEIPDGIQSDPIDIVVSTYRGGNGALPHSFLVNVSLRKYIK